MRMQKEHIQEVDPGHRTEQGEFPAEFQQQDNSSYKREEHFTRRIPDPDAKQKPIIGSQRQEKNPER